MNEHDTALVRQQLCPTGTLRAAINMTNGLLVTGLGDSGEPVGVSPDMAAAIASKLEVPVQLKPYPGPGFVADALAEDAWDIGNIANEPARAKLICFSPSYCEIQATYLVWEDEPLKTPKDVDAPGRRIAAKARAAYELWLSDNLSQAELETTDSFDSSVELFVSQHLDALAGLRPALLKEHKNIPGTRLMEQSFTAVQQSIGCRHGIPEAAQWLQNFVNESLRNGFVAELIERHGVTGRLSPSPSLN